MTPLELLVLLVIAGIVGAIAEYLVGFHPGGFLISIVVGVIGAFIGTWLARRLGLPVILPVRIRTQTLEIVGAVLGSIVLVVLIKLLRGPRRFYRGYARRRYYR